MIVLFIFHNYNKKKFHTAYSDEYIGKNNFL